MQRLTYVVSMSLSHNHGKRPFQSCWSTHNFSVHQPRSQTNDRGYWFGNETGCAHAYKIKKWRPLQRTAASLVPRPHPKIGKGAWCYLQIFPYVLCQQSSFGVEESRSSIANYNIPSSIISHSLEFLPRDKRTKSMT